MIELKKNEYDILWKVFPEHHDYVEVPMIISQRRGRAWIDDAAKPRTGMLWCGEMAFIEGHYSKGMISEPLKEIDASELEICCSRSYKNEVGSLYEDLKPTFNFMYDHDGAGRRIESPGGFKIQKIDSDTFYRLAETGEKWLVSMYTDFGDFRDVCSLGYVAIAQDILVAASVPYGYDGKRANIGVATHPDFQQLGLSSALTSLLIADLLSLNVAPVWITNPDNRASQKVAEKNGFRLVKKLPIFWVSHTIDE